jgi:putative NADH-flavin reductase
MRLLVLGATGRTGAELLVQALTQGHQVTALARDLGRLSVQDERVHAIAGSATDRAVIHAALEGQDAVLCALGPRSPTALLSFDLMRATVEALIPSMQAQRVDRIVMLSALGAGQSAAHAPALFRLMFRTLFRQVGNDKAIAEAMLEESELDWTIVYPPSLTNGARTGNYRHGPALEVHRMPRISRADVAQFMLAQLTDHNYSRKPAIICSR